MSRSYMYLLRGRTPSQMMSFVLQTENGQLFVIDGGVRGDAEALLALLRKLGGPHPVIEGWFLTHVHEDHIAALTSILESRLNELEIKRLYFHFPERPFIADNEAWEIHTWDEFYAALPNYQGIKTVYQQGDRYEYPEARFEVLYTYDGSYPMNAINNSSTVLRLTTGGRRVLLLGDLGIEGGRRLLAGHGAGGLRSDVVQLAHHGQNGVEKSVYEAAAPQACLWCTPLWLWENDPGQGYNSGPWKTFEVRRWIIDELKVPLNWVAKDGDRKLILSPEELIIKPYN